MKKFIKTFLLLLFVCASVVCPFFGTQNSKVVNASEISPANTSPIETLLANVAISTDGYVFSAGDFEQKNNANYLYVNTNITLTKINPSNFYSVDITHQQREGTSTWIPLGTSTLTNLNKSFTITYNGLNENVTRLELKASNSTNYSFYLIQTPNRFAVNPIYSWEDKDNKLVIAPSNTYIYLDELTLKGVKGTADCPIFVDFHYNGEFYSLYNINGVFYNTITDNPLKNISAVDPALVFNVPGEYEVFIYDKTSQKNLISTTLYEGTEQEKTIYAFNKNASNNFYYSNCERFKFTIKKSANSADNIYIIAKNNAGKTIVSKESVNSAVNLNFNNLSADLIGKIDVKRYYSTIDGNNRLETKTMFPGEYTISQLANNPIVFEEDGSYSIILYGHNNLPINGEGFMFTILKDIHSSYDNLESTNRDLVPESNTIYTIEKTEFHSTFFKGFTEIIDNNGTPSESYLTSSTTSTFDVKLARANIAIDGVMNGDTVTGSVNLTFRGVGNIEVIVSTDSKTERITVSNNQTVNFNTIGKYRVIITDEMGTTTTKSFNINRSLSGASIALIVVSSVAVALLLFFIIRTRTNIKVR